MSTIYKYHFHESKKRMKSSVYLFATLLIGFIVYWLIKDKLFDNYDNSNNKITVKSSDGFEHPGKAPIEIRQAPIYPERTVAASGPNPPSQAAPGNETVVYSDPSPMDPYSETQQSSDIPEELRYPERSFRAPPINTNTQIAVESGVASNNHQISAQNNQRFSTDFIQNDGEFMPGIFANDTSLDTNYSAF